MADGVDQRLGPGLQAGEEPGDGVVDRLKDASLRRGERREEIGELLGECAGDEPVRRPETEGCGVRFPDRTGDAVLFGVVRRVAVGERHLHVADADGIREVGVGEVLGRPPVGLLQNEIGASLPQPFPERGGRGDVGRKNPGEVGAEAVDVEDLRMARLLGALAEGVEEVIVLTDVRRGVREVAV